MGCRVLYFVSAVCLVAGLTHTGRADPPTSAQVATAMEDLVVKAIAQAEDSVVAIARVPLEDGVDAFDAGLGAFNQFRTLPLPRPGDADFIPQDFATGVVVDRGLILTANHVLREKSEYWVTTSSRKTYKVLKIVGADPVSDLAVLQIDAPDLVPIKFGDASKLKKGQFVIALGNPYAIARDGQVSASWGLISNLNRKDGPWPAIAGEQQGLAKPTLHQYGTLIQTDARLNLGTSGGALVNLQGEMIGMTVSLAATLGYEQPAGFALPVDETFMRALKALKHGNEVAFAFLGVQLRHPADLRFRGKQGVQVDPVAGTPAGRSLLASGDIVTHVDDRKVHDPDEFMLALRRLPPEASVRLTVERESEGRVHSIIIPELIKDWTWRKKVVTNPPPAWRGMRVDYLSAKGFRTQMAEAPAKPSRVDQQGSIVVTEVEPDSPAWKAGLRADTMVSHVAGKRVRNPREFFEAVANKEGPLKLRLSPPSEPAERTIAAE